MCPQLSPQALAHALNDALARAAANRETRLEALALEDCQVGEEGAKAGGRTSERSASGSPARPSPLGDTWSHGALLDCQGWGWEVFQVLEVVEGGQGVRMGG